MEMKSRNGDENSKFLTLGKIAFPGFSFQPYRTPSIILQETQEENKALEWLQSWKLINLNFEHRSGADLLYANIQVIYHFRISLTLTIDNQSTL